MQVKFIPVALITLAVMAAPFTADARPHHEGRSHREEVSRQMQQLPQEKVTQAHSMWAEHHKATQPLHNDLWSKRTLLKALSGNPKVEPKEIRDLVAEIGSLRAKLQDSRLAFAAKLKKEIGVDFGEAFSRHEKDFSGGKHGGGHRGGYGKGCGC